jgi:hypothetical protein
MAQLRKTEETVSSELIKMKTFMEEKTGGEKEEASLGGETGGEKEQALLGGEGALNGKRPAPY